MSQGHSKESHGAAGGLKHVAAQEHKVARDAHKVDSAVYMGEVLSSGDPKRVERYFLRKLAYKLFGRFMGKTVNRIR
ncbi:MAG TPA: hypothetical protein VIC27_01770 [Ktedonobacterales bacterium]|jgi:hypothetical protein